MPNAFAEVVGEARRPAGRSTVTVRCPYCGCEIEARLWSLAGVGQALRVVQEEREPCVHVGADRLHADPRDFLAEGITLRRGLVGAKPERVCSWVLDLIGWQPGDELVDVFPGTGVMGRVVAMREMRVPDALELEPMFAMPESIGPES